jgi:hypothetical protein
VPDALERYDPERLRWTLPVTASAERAAGCLVERVGGAVYVAESGATWCTLVRRDGRVAHRVRVECCAREGGADVVLTFADEVVGHDGTLTVGVSLGFLILGLVLWSQSPFEGFLLTALSVFGIGMVQALARRPTLEARAAFAAIAAEVDRALAEFRPGEANPVYRGLSAASGERR